MDNRVIVNALSFDVEEWFQAEVFANIFPQDQWERLESRVDRQVDLVLGLLEEHGIKATFFTLGWIAERYGEVVGKIISDGHELACHGYSHTMITKQSRGDFEEDLKRARGVLEDIYGKRVRGYRAPTFSITEEARWALEILCANGFHYDSSIYPIRHDRYGIPNSPRFPYPVVERGGRRLWEFPGPTKRIAGATLPAAGGGYLRLFPYWWASSAVRAANRIGQPVNVYAHPWEFDDSLPIVSLPAVARFRHYRGIRGNARKLRGLLKEFRFAPMGEIIDKLQLNRSER